MTGARQSATARILGIDPGLRITGFGIIESDGTSSSYVHSGSIRNTGSEAGMAQRLGLIFSQLTQIITRYQPDEVAVEEVFVSRNISSALKLGHARGAIISAAVQLQVPVSEYSARTVKQAVVGNGAASKQQVQHMVLRLLGLRGELQADEADALAVSLCHAHSSRLAGSFHASLSGIHA
ncbi:MAG: crossover junction endodeoxyribonuclease RuvC [Gammaproteobacteria bacterium]|nr:crossover junction endodeoxyribonuclease RuvC [Gammaproteobacteria bacterium]